MEVTNPSQVRGLSSQDTLADVAHLSLAVSSCWQNIPEVFERYGESRHSGFEKSDPSFISLFLHPGANRTSKRPGSVLKELPEEGYLSPKDLFPCGNAGEEGGHRQPLYAVQSSRDLKRNDSCRRYNRRFLLRKKNPERAGDSHPRYRRK